MFAGILPAAADLFGGAVTAGMKQSQDSLVHSWVIGLGLRVRARHKRNYVIGWLGTDTVIRSS